MKTLTYFLIIALGQAILAAEIGLPGRPFPGEKIEVVWKATNQLPSNVWVYKVEPQVFLPAAISNLMALGNFTEKDRTTPDGKPSKDKQIRYYENKDGTRKLSIYPPNGWINYSEDTTWTPEPYQMTNRVPDEKEVMKLALQWVGLFGLAPVELARKEKGRDYDTLREVTTIGWWGKTNNNYTEGARQRGISFLRCVDGIPFTSGGSQGGFRVNYGKEGTLADLELVWLNLKRYKSYKVASPTLIQKFVKEGKARIVPLTEMDLTNAKSLIINKAVMSYLGCNGEKPQEFMYPFVALVCTAGFDDGTRKQIVLQCPIIAE